MSVSGRLIMAAGAGLVGALFIGYCIYFDRKRRSDPEFKEKLRRKRASRKARKKSPEEIVFPDCADPIVLQKFFINEVHASETFSAMGDYDEAGSHLAAAVVCIGEPPEVMESLSQSVPHQVLSACNKYLPARRAQARQTISNMMMMSGEPVMTDIGFDDLE